MQRNGGCFDEKEISLLLANIRTCRYALAFLTKVISLDTYLTMMGGIIVFVGIPETIKAIKDKDRIENL